MDNDRIENIKWAYEEMKDNSFDQPIEMIVMGGFALGYYYENRFTADIDYLCVGSINDEQIKILEKYNIDNRMFGMLEFDVSDIEIKTKYTIGNITYCIPTIEWLTLSKLTSNRGKDLHDLRTYNMIESCNKDFLIKELKEILTYKINTREWNFKEFEIFEELKNMEE